MIKQYWQQRNRREKQLLLAAIGVLAVVLYYFLVWLPLENKLDALRTNLQSEQTLLTWMQQMAPLVKSSRLRTVSDKRELFSIVETNFKTKPVKEKLSFARLGENRVSISFKDVTFNDLLKELVFMKRQFDVQISELQVNRMATEGMVEGRVVLAR